MNINWSSSRKIPEVINKIIQNDFKLDSNSSHSYIINIIPIEDVTKINSSEESYFIWLESNFIINEKLYDNFKQSKHFLGFIGDFLNQKQMFKILKTAQDRKNKNLKQAEIIQKAKSQHLLIENQVKNLNYDVEKKTQELFEYRKQLESRVSFEKESLLILKNLLEASSFNSFFKILLNAFKNFGIQDFMLFYRQTDGFYKLKTESLRLKSLFFSEEQLINFKKTDWANTLSKPILDFKIYSIGNDSDYFLALEFNKYAIDNYDRIQEHLTYLQYIFKMVLDYLFDQEQMVNESLLWSSSFNSLDDPLLIVDSFYNIIKSNSKNLREGQKCFKELFNRTSPCLNCPVNGKKERVEKTLLNLENKYNLHSFPLQLGEDFEENLWIHHYENTASINELKAQYIKAEKFSYIGNLVDNVIHQISNPLTGMKASVEFLLTEKSPDLESDLIEVQGGLDRSFEIINNLKDFSQSETQMTKVNLLSLVSKTLTLMKSVTRDIKFDISNLEDKEVLCPTGLVQQVLFNLIYNSCQAMNFAGSIKIEAHQNKDFIELLILDSGPGISADIRSKIFDPFFSTKVKDHGTGIGLFLSRQIMRQFGGDIEVMNNLSPGAELCIKFPLRME